MTLRFAAGYCCPTVMSLTKQNHAPNGQHYPFRSLLTINLNWHCCLLQISMLVLTDRFSQGFPWLLGSQLISRLSKLLSHYLRLLVESDRFKPLVYFCVWNPIDWLSVSAVMNLLWDGCKIPAATGRVLCLDSRKHCHLLKPTTASHFKIAQFTLKTTLFHCSAHRWSSAGLRFK